MGGRGGGWVLGVARRQEPGVGFAGEGGGGREAAWACCPSAWDAPRPPLGHPEQQAPALGKSRVLRVYLTGLKKPIQTLNP